MNFLFYQSANILQIFLNIPLSLRFLFQLRQRGLVIYERSLLQICKYTPTLLKHSLIITFLPHLTFRGEESSPLAFLDLFFIRLSYATISDIQYSITSSSFFLLSVEEDNNSACFVLNCSTEENGWIWRPPWLASKYRRQKVK